MPTLEPVAPVTHLHAFTGFGIELEYMIADTENMRVMPLADRVLEAVAGEIVNETDQGELAWSNELVLHVIELKTNGPASTLSGLDGLFHRDILRINELLRPHGARLLPGAMHPLFDPDSETRLWPHGQNEIYQAYDRIFSCRGHGWSNLQSMHINLPFFDDAEFTRLHAAIRLVLPLIPALAASSPFVQGRATGWLDSRLDFYRRNQAAIQEIAGLIVPEAVNGIGAYHERILQPMYRAIAPHDADGVLQDDWLNSRGAIARFERQTIEIRVIDLQEYPSADLAIATVVAGLVRALYDERLCPLQRQQAVTTESLSALLLSAARNGPAARVTDTSMAAALGVDAGARLDAVWQHLVDQVIQPDLDGTAGAALDVLLAHGPLAGRMLAFAGDAPAPQRLAALCHALSQCLIDNRPFLP